MNSLPHDLGLAPNDLLLPAWRTEFGLTLPPAAAFDVAAAAKRLRKCCHPNGYLHSPENAGIPLSMTPEEAWFWLRSMSRGCFDRAKFDSAEAPQIPSREQVHQHLAEGICTRDNDPGMCSVMSESWCPEQACALRTLLSTGEILDFIATNMAAFELSGLSQYSGGFGNLLAGCCMYVTPYLTRAECEHHAEKHHAALRDGPDLKHPRSITALAILAVLGQSEAVTQTLYETTAKMRHSCTWLFARTNSLDDFVTLRKKLGQKPCGGVHPFRHMLSALGLSRLDELQQFIIGLKPDQTRILKVLRRVRHPEVAPLMLELRAKHKDAGEWLRENALLAAAGLAPHAAGTEAQLPAARVFWEELWQKDAKTAREALRYIAPPLAVELQTLEKASSSVAGPAPANLPEDLQQALDAVRVRVLPAWLSVAALPSPQFQGQRLGPLQVTAFIEALKSGKATSPPALVLKMKKHCEAASLDALAEALFQQWRRAAHPPADLWVLFAVGWLGSDDAHLRLARYLVYRPMTSPWPHARACAGVRALAMAGTRAAVSQLYRLARATYESMQKTEALQSLDLLSKNAGICLEELADANVPDAGFDLAGTCQFQVSNLTF